MSRVSRSSISLRRSVRPPAHLHEERVARHLHGDRAEPFAHAHVADVGGRGAEQAAPVEPVVLVEAAVLGGEERLPHVQRDRVERDVHAPHDGDAAEESVAAGRGSCRPRPAGTRGSRRASGSRRSRRSGSQRVEQDRRRRSRAASAATASASCRRIQTRAGSRRRVHALAQHGDALPDGEREVRHLDSQGVVLCTATAQAGFRPRSAARQN